MHVVNEESSTQFSIFFPLYFLEYSYILNYRALDFFLFFFISTPFPEVKMWISNSIIVSKIHW